MGKTVLQLVEEKMDCFTSAQRKVADYILKHPTEVAFQTTEQLAGLIGVSVATVMRLAYVLGYTGYSQFQKDLQGLLRNRVSPPTRLEVNVRKLGKNKLLIDCAEVQISNIKKTVEFLTDDMINNAFKLIFSAEKIYVLGTRSSSSAANYLNEGLNRVGVECEWLTPDTGRLQSVLAKTSANDLFIAISLPRYGKRTVEAVRVAKSRGAKIVLLTDGYSSPLALLADVLLPCAFESLSFHHSGIGAIFVADFLVTGVAMQDPRKTKRHLEEIESVAVALESNLIKS